MSKLIDPIKIAKDMTVRVTNPDADARKKWPRYQSPVIGLVEDVWLSPSGKTCFRLKGETLTFWVNPDTPFLVEVVDV